MLNTLDINDAYKILENSEKYKKVMETIPYIDGTFDDHDFGIIVYYGIINTTFLGDFWILVTEFKQGLRYSILLSGEL